MASSWCAAAARCARGVACRAPSAAFGVARPMAPLASLSRMLCGGPQTALPLCRRGPIILEKPFYAFSSAPRALSASAAAMARARPARGRRQVKPEQSLMGAFSSPMTKKAEDDKSQSVEEYLEKSQLKTLEDRATQKYVASVYKQAGSSIGVATAVSVGSIATGLMVSPLIPIFAGMVPLYMFYQTSPATHSAAYRFGLVGTFAGLTGLSLAPLVATATSMNPMLIPMALGGTGLVFAGAAGAALLAPRASMLKFGTLLGGGSAVMFGAFLFGSAQYMMTGHVSPLLFQFQLYGGLGLITAWVAYDTHNMIEEYSEGIRDPLRHSMDIFVNFVGLFRRILMILMMRDD